MKKLITLLLAVSILLTSVSVFASNPADELKAIGVSAELLNSSSEYITRAEFAHMSAKLLDGEEKITSHDVFSDVTANDKYAGDIQFLKNIGVVNGSDNNMFLPNDNITWAAACKIVLNVMGYESLAQSLGGYPDGYYAMADEMRLASNTEVKDGYLTKNGAEKLISYALTSKIYSYTYVVNNENKAIQIAGEADVTLLSKRGISAYIGTVESVELNGNISFKVSKNKYDTNPNMAINGEKLNLTLPAGYDAYEFEKVSVELWADEEGNIIYIQPHKKANVLYGFIDSVNDDTSDKGYGIKYINKITLLNDEEEYDVNPTAVLRFNGKETTAAQVLNGKFAKVVLTDDEITFIEAWSSEKGGIITAINNDEISYIKESSGSVKLKDIDSYRIKRIFINGEVSSFDNLKKDTVFDYVTYDNTIMIIANETVITDVLKTVSFNSGKINIGGITYKIKTLYHSADGLNYITDKELKALFNQNVKAYLDPMGYVRYITPESADSVTKNKFFGVVLGVETDVFGENREISLYRIYESEFKKETYKVSDKTVYTDTTWEKVAKSAKNLEGEGVFEFSVNASGVITDISAPRLFDGFGTATKNYTTASFGSLGTPYVTINGKTLYFPDSKMVCLYELDGEFLLGTVDWMTSLYGQSLAQSLTLSFYKDDSDSTYPALIIITGGVNSLAYRESKLGMYAGYSYTIDKNGEKAVNVHVYTGQKEYTTFKVSEDFVKNNFGDMKYGLISYKDQYLFADNKISVSSKTDLSNSSLDWNVIEEENKSGMHKGVVKRIDNNRLWLSNGETYFMNGTSSTRLFFELNENMPQDKAIKPIEYGDISPGDEIFYYLSGSLTVSVVIKVV